MTARTLADLRFIDVHHHVVLPEYEKALVRSGVGDPSRPFRRNDPPGAVLLNEVYQNRFARSGYVDLTSSA